MRFFYCDPALTNDLGHHANSCRGIAGELRRRGIETYVLAHGDIDAGLQSEVGAEKLFRYSTYAYCDDDPVCGWLSTFMQVCRITAEDFRSLEPHLRDDDLVYVNSGQAAQLMALVSWMKICPRPFRAVMEFGVDPGLDIRVTANGRIADTRDPRTDPRAIFYRLAANEIDDAIASRLHLVTFDPAASEAYQLLLRRPVKTVPMPRERVTATLRPRAGRRPITVAFLGHQRWEKGYHFVPEILRQLDEAIPADRLRFLVHNCSPGEMTDPQTALREFASANPRCILDERPAGQSLWADLLDRSDLIVCPYYPDRFTLAYSALASDAVANGYSSRCSGRHHPGAGRPGIWERCDLSRVDGEFRGPRHHSRRPEFR
jgi:hypothetical protein